MAVAGMWCCVQHRSIAPCCSPVHINTFTWSIYSSSVFCPRFTLLASRGKDLPVHGDGMSVRSYLYVEDVAEAFDVVLHKGVLGERW
jgi:nucleoside-diphosphate-sugar epimerase